MKLNNLFSVASLTTFTFYKCPLFKSVLKPHGDEDEFSKWLKQFVNVFWSYFKSNPFVFVYFFSTHNYFCAHIFLFCVARTQELRHSKY